MRMGSPPLNWDPEVALWKMWFHIQHLENIDQAMYYLGCECGCVQPHVWKSAPTRGNKIQLLTRARSGLFESLEMNGALCVQELRLEMFAMCNPCGNCYFSLWVGIHSVLCSVFSVLYTQVQAKIYRCMKKAQMKTMFDKNASVQLVTCIFVPCNYLFLKLPNGDKSPGQPSKKHTLA